MLKFGYHWGAPNLHFWHQDRVPVLTRHSFEALFAKIAARGTPRYPKCSKNAPKSDPKVSKNTK